MRLHVNLFVLHALEGSLAFEIEVEGTAYLTAYLMEVEKFLIKWRFSKMALEGSLAFEIEVEGTAYLTVTNLDD